MKISSINPASGKIIKTYETLTPEQTTEKISKADAAFQEWKYTSFAHRAEKMRTAANLLIERKESLGRLISLEMGKVLRESVAEVEKCAWVCNYYADNAHRFLQNERVETDATLSYVTFQPIGLVLAVMPWNFPFWQVFRFAAPALMAGNGGLLKHASNVPGCGIAIEQLLLDAGFPKGLFTNLLIRHGQVEEVIANPLVKAVTLTGSEFAGRAVAESAGRHLKKTVLELGGSDAFIILEDADLEKAAETAKNSRLLNAGQSCIAAKRFIVVEAVYDEFVRLFSEKMEAAKVGEQFDAANTIGPMAREDLRDELDEQVEKSISNGASVIMRGSVPQGGGAFYPPTILVNVKSGMPAFDEELFGPVAAVIKAKDEKEAIAIANTSVFGLGATVFTRDLERGERIAAYELNAGSCFVNEFVKSDPRLPFGGVKVSGFGRELSHYGIKEFVNIKTVYIK